MRLDGRAAIVTGGSRGIGRDICLALAEQGADVSFAYHRSEEGARALESEIRAMGRRCCAVRADVADSADVTRFVAQSAGELGKADILVNCAGIFPQALLEDITDEDWERVLRINLYGAFYACRAVVPYLKKSGAHGRIINLSSQAALNGTAHGAHYGASKAALLGLTYCLAKELGPFGITVNAILPGRIDTEMLAYADEKRRETWLAATPLGRFGKERDVAALAAFLASDEGGYITGAKINVNGGLSVG